MITEVQVQGEIKKVFLHHFPGTKTVVCALQLQNGHVVIGEAHAAEDVVFDSRIGADSARQDAEAKVYSLLAFKERQQRYEG